LSLLLSQKKEEEEEDHDRGGQKKKKGKDKRKKKTRKKPLQRPHFPNEKRPFFFFLSPPLPCTLAISFTRAKKTSFTFWLACNQAKSRKDSLEEEREGKKRQDKTQIQRRGSTEGAKENEYGPHLCRGIEAGCFDALCESLERLVVNHPVV